jgi:hypothetical protein
LGNTRRYKRYGYGISVKVSRDTKTVSKCQDVKEIQIQRKGEKYKYRCQGERGEEEKSVK